MNGLRYLRYGHIKTVWESCQNESAYTTLAPPDPPSTLYFCIVIQNAFAPAAGAHFYASVQLSQYRQIQTSQLHDYLPWDTTKQFWCSLHWDCF